MRPTKQVWYTSTSETEAEGSIDELTARCITLPWERGPSVMDVPTQIAWSTGDCACTCGITTGGQIRQMDQHVNCPGGWICWNQSGLTRWRTQCGPSRWMASKKTNTLIVSQQPVRGDGPQHTVLAKVLKGSEELRVLTSSTASRSLTYSTVMCM